MGRFNRWMLAALFLNLTALAGCAELIPRDTFSKLFSGFNRSDVIGFVAGLGTTFAANAGLGRNAQAPIQRGHEPQDGGHFGHFSDPLDLLWPFGWVTTGDRMELRGCADQFPERRCTSSFRPQRKSQAIESSLTVEWLAMLQTNNVGGNEGRPRADRGSSHDRKNIPK
jgi:hypothetical protein